MNSKPSDGGGGKNAPGRFVSKVAYFYKEGDQSFPPYRLVVSKKRYPSLADLCTDLQKQMQLTHGVRGIYSPKGHHPIRDLDQIVDDGRYVCSSVPIPPLGDVHGRVNGVDPENMDLAMTARQPWKAPPNQNLNYNRQDSRFIRTGLPDNENSFDDMLLDVTKRLKQQDQFRRMATRDDIESARNDSTWATRLKRIVVMKNGDPNHVRHYTLTRATAPNLLRIKSDFSEMFGAPIDKIFTANGQPIDDVEDMFAANTTGFVVSLGERFKPNPKYSGHSTSVVAQGEGHGTLPAPQLLRTQTMTLTSAKDPVGKIGKRSVGRKSNDIPTALSDPSPRANSKQQPTTPLMRRQTPGSKTPGGAFQLSTETSAYDFLREGIPKLSSDDPYGTPPNRSRTNSMGRATPRGPTKTQSQRVAGQLRSTSPVGHLPQLISRQQQQSMGASMNAPGRTSKKGVKFQSPLPGNRPRNQLSESTPNLPMVAQYQGTKSLKNASNKKLQRTSSNPDMFAEAMSYNGPQSSMDDMSLTGAGRKTPNNRRPVDSTTVVDPTITGRLPALARNVDRKVVEKHDKIIASRGKAGGMTRVNMSRKGDNGAARTWTFTILTGEQPNAGTTSKLHITAYGHKGSTEALEFVPPHGMFQPGIKETFRQKVAGIGEVYKIRVESSGSGTHPDWLCDLIIIEDMLTGEVLHFPCKRWLSGRIGDHQLIREIPALTDSRPPVSLVHYEISVVTGDIWDAGTSGTVTITIFGERGDSGKRVLSHPAKTAASLKAFLKGQTDVFKIECVSLGEIRRIKVQLTPGPTPGGWYVESITVRERDLRAGFIFPFYRWINHLEDDRSLDVEVRAVDTIAFRKIQDRQMWPCESWKFNDPEAELVFFSTASKKALRITSGGMIDGRSEIMDRTDGWAVFKVQYPEHRTGDRKDVVALCTDSKMPSYLSFSGQHKVVSRPDYVQGCDIRIHVSSNVTVQLESDKYPNNFLGIESSGQLHPDTENAMPGPTQSFYCYVKGCFRDEGVIMLCTSHRQTLCIDRDPSLLTALGKRNKLAHFRVIKVANGNVRMFESVIFAGCFLQIRKGVANCSGIGDNYCEFRVKRNREQNFVTLESVRERACFIEFSPNGTVYPHVEPNGTLPHLRMFPEVVQWGTRKGKGHAADKTGVRQAKVPVPQQRVAVPQPNRSDRSPTNRLEQADRDGDRSNESIDSLYRDRYRPPGQRHQEKWRRRPGAEDEDWDEDEARRKRIAELKVQRNKATIIGEMHRNSNQPVKYPPSHPMPGSRPGPRKAGDPPTTSFVVVSNTKPNESNQNQRKANPPPPPPVARQQQQQQQFNNNRSESREEQQQRQRRSSIRTTPSTETEGVRSNRQTNGSPRKQVTIREENSRASRASRASDEIDEDDDA